MAVKQVRYNGRLVICFVLLSVLVEFGESLRGLGYPNRELFEDDNKPSPAPQRATGSPAPGSTPSNSSAGLTMSGLKEELGGMRDKAKDYEHRHSKATVAAAATIGSLLLVSAVGCAGMWAYRRFVRSQHTSNKRSRADKQPYYNADRLLGDPAGL